MFKLVLEKAEEPEIKLPTSTAATAAKSLQSCPTLCDPIDGNPPGSPVPGILQARTLEWVAISFSNAWKWKVKVKVKSCPTPSDPMDCSLPGSSIHGICQARVLEWVAIEKAREFQKNIYFCFTDYAKAFDCVDHSKLWKILQDMGIPDHLICLLRNLYAGQEATVRTGHGTTNRFQIVMGVHPGCILSPCLFNLYAEYFMQNSGLDEAPAGIKIARRNINNLKYTDDTTPYGRKRRRPSLWKWKKRVKKLA